MLRARRSFLLPLVAIALLIPACGDDDSSTTAASTETVTDETTSTTAEDDSRATVVVRGASGFTSPTGNIGCFIDKEMVRCDIADRDWEPPKAPASCDLDYGQGIELRAGAEPEFVCAGDATLDAGEELPYGESIQGGLVRCDMEEAGITCIDVESGRGFTLSKQAYELF